MAADPARACARAIEPHMAEEETDIFPPARRQALRQENAALFEAMNKEASSWPDRRRLNDTSPGEGRGRGSDLLRNPRSCEVARPSWAHRHREDPSGVASAHMARYRRAIAM